MISTFERGALFLPDQEGGLVYHQDGLVVVRDGNIEFAGPVGGVQQQGGVLHPNGNLQYQGQNFKPQPSRVILPPTVSTHSHLFQPPGIPGELIRDVDGEKVGWLPLTLRFETIVRRDPSRAKAIARANFASDIANGITGVLEYTTSSEEAVRIVLKVAEEMGLKGRVKVGYVCMDQGVDFIDGVELETSADEAVAATERLLKDFPGDIVIIDRFPIACSSALRRRLIALARQHNARIETHAFESEGEAEIHSAIYHEKIIDTLFADGLFEPGLFVGIAHGVLGTSRTIDRIARAVQAGCNVHVHACPNSNAQLGSHITRDTAHVPFPLTQWKDAGVTMSFGLDRGAGRGRNIFQEALWERGRPHFQGKIPENEGRAAYFRLAVRSFLKGLGFPVSLTERGERYTPSYQELLAMATTGGSRCLDLQDGLRPNDPANYIVVGVDGIDTFYARAPEDAERMAGLVIESAQDSRLVQKVVVNGVARKEAA